MNDKYSARQSTCTHKGLNLLPLYKVLLTDNTTISLSPSPHPTDHFGCINWSSTVYRNLFENKFVYFWLYPCVQCAQPICIYVIRLWKGMPLPAVGFSKAGQCTLFCFKIHFCLFPRVLIMGGDLYWGSGTEVFNPTTYTCI